MGLVDWNSASLESSLVLHRGFQHCSFPKRTVGGITSYPGYGEFF